MTTINNLDDFLQALDANPSWREAVRSQILGEELLQLPVRFSAFANQQEAWNAKQETWNENATIPFNRIEADMSSLKGDYARTRTIQDARGIAADLGQSGLGLKANIFRHSGLPTPLPVLGPDLGQVQLPIQKCPSFDAGIGQE